MKKRFFSSLLMGALVTATLSTVTSCKDYDDDISNLQGQIDKLATADQLQQKVDELKGLISANSSDINTLKSELAKKTTLDEVKTLLADYATKKYVDDADATLEAAIKALQTKDIAELKTLVEKAQTTADQAKDDASKAKAEIIETLQSYASKTDLDEAKQAAMDAIAALQTSNAAALQEAVDALNNSITEAKNAAKDADDKAVNNAAAIEALGETVTKAAHADSLATANKTAIENASKLLGAGFSEENTVKAAIDAITGQLGAKNTGLADLDSRLSAIETVLNGVKDDDTKLGLSTKITNIETDLRTIIGEYTTMVTSVSLYKTSANRWSNGLPDNDLTFIWVPSEHTTKFPVDGKVADNQIEFSADHKNITITDSLVIRVSPTNAELTPSNVTLINSQGKELSEFVEVQSVKPYKKLITGATRAANETEGNGLWTVTFKLKDGVDIDKFEEATVSQNSYVQFAVAVKNTASSKTRRVITAYDVAAKGSSYEPANNNILVQGNDDVWKDIRNIRNRFDMVSVNGQETPTAYSRETNERKYNVKELEWSGSEPYTAEEAANHTQLAKNNDQRAWSSHLLPVTVGKKINICLGAMLQNGVPYYYNTETGRGYAVKGFYVTLDKDFAIESAPSELNAWAKYSYENVGVTNSKGTITKAAHMFYGNEGYITINSLEDTEVKGDIIGFRVYAVNFDGTLVDPDGRAFYVKVGDAKDQQTVAEANATINATATGSQYFKNYGSESNFFANIKTDAFDVNATKISDWTVDYTNNPGDLGNDPIKDLKYGEDFNVKYYDKDGNQVSVSANPVSAKVFLLKPQRFVDGGTYTIKATLSDATHELRDVTLKFTKVMPTAKNIKALSYVNEELVPNNLFSNVTWTSSNIYKFYQNPANDGTIYEKVVSREMKDYLSGLVDNHYTLWFENLNVEQSAIVSNYAYEVNRKNIDGKEHAINYSYDFGPISCTHSYVTGEWKRPNVYVVNAESSLKMLFNTWLNKETWAWVDKYEPKLTWKAGSPIYGQTISASKIAGKNSLLNRFNSDLQSLFAAGYTQIAENADGTPMVSFSNDAFKVTPRVYHSTNQGGNSTIDFVFDQTTKTTIPTATGELTVGLEDCFGQVKVVTLKGIKIERE